MSMQGKGMSSFELWAGDSGSAGAPGGGRRDGKARWCGQHAKGQQGDLGGGGDGHFSAWRQQGSTPRRRGKPGGEEQRRWGKPRRGGGASVFQERRKKKEGRGGFVIFQNSRS